KFVKGRDLARKVLRSDPESVPARYALAIALYEGQGQGSLPRALHEIRKARKILERRGRANPADADAREWYLRVLAKEYYILRDLDRPEEQLRLVEGVERIYAPLPWLKVWPLFKLKRLGEARRAI